jgi:hypothetical protein
MHYVIEICDRFGHWSDDAAWLSGGFSEGTNHWPSYSMANSARTHMIMIGVKPERIRIVARD